MIYEPVLVGSFEDAMMGIIMNGKVEAVVIYDGIPVPSQHDVPLLRDFLTVHHQLDTSSLAPRDVGVTLARFIKRVRPELDIYLLTDREVEKLAGDRPEYLAVINEFGAIDRSVLDVFTSSGELVYQEVLPEECFAIAVLPSTDPSGVSELLVGGERTVWRYQAVNEAQMPRK